MEDADRILGSVRPALTIPDWAARTPRQTAVLLADGSPSMRGEKARASGEALVALVEALAAPSNRDGFSVAVFSFAGEPRERLRRCPAAEARARLRGFDPTQGHGDSTDLASALTSAEQPVREATGEGELRPVVVLFSDGLHNRGGNPEEPAARLRLAADVVTIAFALGPEERQGEELLRRLASTPQHFTACRDGATLRQFFAAVGATLSQSIRRGTNASSALALLTTQRRG